MIIQADALEGLRGLPSELVQCVVTSPPYWGLRDYGVEGQIGLEATPSAYLERLRVIFQEVSRVLRVDGTLWLNIGDGYTSGGRKTRDPDRRVPARSSFRPPTPPGLKPKDLLGIPYQLASVLQADGWYWRADVIWRKPNAMPESVKDRPIRTYEHLLMLTKSAHYRYYFPGLPDVWDINTKGSREGHPASYPLELARTCILASSQKGDWVLDPFFGIGTTGMAAQQLERHCIGIEINPDYARTAASRLGG